MRNMGLLPCCHTTQCLALGHPRKPRHDNLSNSVTAALRPAVLARCLEVSKVNPGGAAARIGIMEGDILRMANNVMLRKRPHETETE